MCTWLISLIMSDYLGIAYPALAANLRKTTIASLPTPVSHHDIHTSAGKRTIVVKHDDQTNALYGGNKIRKLEYILQRARERGAERVATFGAVGSNHALATALHAKELGLDCTCFLAHQVRTPNIRKALDTHLRLGTELVRWGGGVNRLELYRRYLQNRKTWVIPLGGTCWLGAVGFVNAGLEIAAQIDVGELKIPDRIYIANGTMGSVAGLGIGIALAGLETEIHAIRVADNRFVKREVLDRLMAKTAKLLNRYDSSIPADISGQAKIVWRGEFYAGGYAAIDDVTNKAVGFARDQLNLTLETTYTGKAFAALLHDLSFTDDDANYLFWNTYNSAELPTTSHSGGPRPGLPSQFERYFEGHG
jgi:1-aminocyclopropane-1-carboxylate deaminase/D-cysteine desulfhydrase-like pyridoxal-dependent ACC family enzyme